MGIFLVFVLIFIISLSKEIFAGVFFILTTSMFWVFFLFFVGFFSGGGGEDGGGGRDIIPVHKY